LFATLPPLEQGILLDELPLQIALAIVGVNRPPDVKTSG
jgi:hypothetical protein